MPREAIEDLTTYATKEPTDLQARFAEWIPEQTGYDPSSAKSKLEAFNEGVRLATAMRMIFQASPENKAANAARKANGGRAAEPVEEAPAAPAKKAATKAAKKAAPAKSAPPAKAAKSAPPAKRTRRAAAAAPAATEDEAPF